MKFEIDSKLEVSTWDYIGFRIISRSITKVYRRQTAGKDLKVILCHSTKPNPKILNTRLPFHTQPSVGSSREVWTWHKIDIRADYTKKSLWKNRLKIHRFTGLTFLHVLTLIRVICRYEGKYALLPFLGPSAGAIFVEHPKHRNICKWSNAVLWIFSENGFGDGPSLTVPRFWFLGLTDYRQYIFLNDKIVWNQLVE